VTDRKGIARQSFNDIDLLLLPATATTALRIKDANKRLALSSENTIFANYYGLPAVSVPCGFDKHGVPLGLEIVGKPSDEAAILRLAYQFQTATGNSKRPPGRITNWRHYTCACAFPDVLQSMRMQARYSSVLLPPPRC
jgi:aspartyl-tRNA(Asn)/glutamyl-tRNA(Gln) amidotransferase subunit A